MEASFFSYKDFFSCFLFFLCFLFLLIFTGFWFLLVSYFSYTIFQVTFSGIQAFLFHKDPVTLIGFNFKFVRT